MLYFGTMSTKSSKKLNQLLFSTPKGIVLLTSWLNANGYSPDLVKRYRNSGWLESVGFGANIFSGDNVDCFGALYSFFQLPRELQKISNMTSSLALHWI